MSNVGVCKVCGFTTSNAADFDQHSHSDVNSLPEETVDCLDELMKLYHPKRQRRSNRIMQPTDGDNYTPTKREKKCKAETAAAAADQAPKLSTCIQYRHLPNFNVDYHILFSENEANLLFMQLEKEVHYWDSPKLTHATVYGKLHKLKRQHVAYGDPGLIYTFSGIKAETQPWTPLLLSIRDAVQKACNSNFNFVLINRYKDGNASLGLHRDNEADLDPLAAIASVSLGAERDFIFTTKQKGGVIFSQELQNGSLLVMYPPTNHFYYHSLPVRKAVKNPRINLTFRAIKTSTQQSPDSSPSNVDLSHGGDTASPPQSQR